MAKYSLFLFPNAHLSPNGTDIRREVLICHAQRCHLLAGAATTRVDSCDIRILTRSRGPKYFGADGLLWHSLSCLWNKLITVILFPRSRIDSQPLRRVRKLQMEMKREGGINSLSDMQVALISCETNSASSKTGQPSAQLLSTIGSRSMYPSGRVATSHVPLVSVSTQRKLKVILALTSTLSQSPERDRESQVIVLCTSTSSRSLCSEYFILVEF